MAVSAQELWPDHAAVEPLALRRVPLLAAALAFAMGVLAARNYQLTLFLAVASLLLLLLALLAFRFAFRVVPVPVLALWMVVGCWCAQLEHWPAQHPELTTLADGVSRNVHARITRIRMLPANAAPDDAQTFEPGAWESAGTTPTESLDLAVKQAEELGPYVDRMQPVGGGARVVLLDGSPKLHCGDEVELPLRMHLPEQYRDPGVWSYSDELLRQGISVQASARASTLRVIGHVRGDLRCVAFTAQTWASARLARFGSSRANRLLPHAIRFTPEDIAMVSAMLFGDRSSLTHELRTGFERTGTFHLFVVSGLHVALLAGMLFWLLRRLGVSHGFATAFTIASATGYAVLTGFGTPVERALLMTSIFLVARWVDRSVHVMQALGAAALGALIADPRALFDASFQMTFLVLVAVGGLASPLLERFLRPGIEATRHLEERRRDVRFPPRLAQRRLLLRFYGRVLSGTIAHHIHLPRTHPVFRKRWPRLRRMLRALPAFLLRLWLRFWELALVGMLIEACMTLPMAVYFHRATPFAIPANLLAVPLIALLAPLAVVTFCALLISPWLAMVPAALTALVLHMVNMAVRFLSRLHLADLRIPSPVLSAIIAALACLAFACWSLRRRHLRWIAAGLIGVALVPTLTLWPRTPSLHAGVLEVTAIDVGQGDSLIVVSPNGHTLLIDSGGPTGAAAAAENASSRSTQWDIGEEVVAPYLWSRGLRQLDAVVLSHAHSDHMGGMPAVLRAFHPRELWLSIEPADSPALRSLLALAAELHITVRRMHAGDAFPWNDLHASVLAPEPAYRNPGHPLNNDSLVLRLDYGASSVLLEGDAERPSEDAMLANGRLAPVTLLKVAHHGSRTSTTPEFLEAVRPREAVISVGRRNTFGHPRYDTLERLASEHVQVWRTDREGATTFLLSSDGHIITPAAPMVPTSAAETTHGRCGLAQLRSCHQ